MGYSLSGVNFILSQRVKQTIAENKFGDVRDSALLNYIKQWLEWRYDDLHRQEVLVDDVYLTIEGNQDPPLRVDLVLKFEVKTRPSEDADAVWKYGKIIVPFTDNMLGTRFDHGLEQCILSAMERWVSQAKPCEYLAPSDFLDIWGEEHDTRGD